MRNGLGNPQMFGTQCRPDGLAGPPACKCTVALIQPSWRWGRDTGKALGELQEVGSIHHWGLNSESYMLACFLPFELAPCLSYSLFFLKTI